MNESQDLIAQTIKHFTALPRLGTPVSELTERDKVALFIAAGVPTETVMEGSTLTVRTTVPCGISDRGDGGYIIAMRDGRT